MTQYKDSLEIELMREQFSQLKDMLKKERMINEKIMRCTMDAKASKLNRRSWIFIIIAIILTPYIYWAISFINIHPIYGYTGAAFLIIAAIYEIITTISIAKIDLFNSSIMEINDTMLRFKQRNIRWLYFSIPCMLIWDGGMFFEAVKQANTPLILGFSAGLIFGLIIGAITLIKTLRTANEILALSNDLKG